jgi:hypothetical protein
MIGSGIIDKTLYVIFKARFANYTGFKQEAKCRLTSVCGKSTYDVESLSAVIRWCYFLTHSRWDIIRKICRGIEK